MPDLDLEAIERYVGDATPGPWDAWQEADGEWSVGRPEEVEGEIGDSSTLVATEMGEGDALFMVGARGYFRALLDALKAEREENERLARTLLPFALQADEACADDPDDTRLEEAGLGRSLDLGQLRAAWDALGESRVEEMLTSTFTQEGQS